MPRPTTSRSSDEARSPLLARSRIGGRLGGSFGCAFRLLLRRHLALGQLLALRDFFLGLFDARGQSDAREHGLRIVEIGDTFPRRKVGQPEAVADRHAAHVEIDVLGNLHRQGLDADLPLDLREDPALLGAGGLADQLDGHGRLDRLVEPHFLQVDVRDVASNRVLLIVLEDRGMRRVLPLHDDVENRVQPSLPRQDATEFAFGNGDRMWLLAAAVEHTRDEPFTAQPARVGGAAPLALLDLQPDSLTRHFGAE